VWWWQVGCHKGVHGLLHKERNENPGCVHPYLAYHTHTIKPEVTDDFAAHGEAIGGKRRIGKVQLRQADLMKTGS